MSFSIKLYAYYFLYYCFYSDIVFIFIFCGMCFLLLKLRIFKPSVYGLENLEEIKILPLWKKILLIVPVILLIWLMLDDYYDQDTLGDLIENYFLTHGYKRAYFIVLFRKSGFSAFFAAFIFCGLSFLCFILGLKFKILEFQENYPMKTSFFIFISYLLGSLIKDGMGLP